MGKTGQLGGSKNPVGYCHYHKLTLSLTQMRNRQCLEKGCNRFQKYEQHGYWKHVEVEKEKATLKCQEKREAIAKRMRDYERGKARRQEKLAKNSL